MAIVRIGVVVLALGVFASFACPALAEPEPEEILPPPPTAPTDGEPEGMPAGAPPTATDETPAAQPSPASPLTDWRDAPPGKLADRNGPRLPMTVGRTQQQAKRILEGWPVRVENVATSARYIGQVVDQHPDPGTTLARGETVTVVIGVAGVPDRQHGSVPKVEGMAYGDGWKLLIERGAYVADPKTVAHTTAPGTIIDQMPRPGSIAKKASSVVVLVSRGGVEPAATPPPPLAEEAAPSPAGASEVLPPPPTTPAPPSEHEAMPMTPPAPEPPMPKQPMPKQPIPAPPAPLPAPPAPAPAPPKLSAPRLVAPEAGRTAPRAYGASFGWTAVPGAQAYEWELQAEVGKDEWETKDTQTVNANQFRPKRLEKGRFRWRVRAIRDGVEGAWSDFRRLYAY